MNQTTETNPKSTMADRPQLINTKKSIASYIPHVSSYFPYLLSFVIALVACLKQNFTRHVLDAAALFDSGHYLETSRQLLASITNWMQYPTGNNLIELCRAIAEPMMLDGPVLPAVGASFYALIGQTPTLIDMRAALVLQALIQSTNALLVALLVKKLTNSWRWSLVGGILWGLYPAAVFAAARFLTETISVCFVLLFILVCVRLIEITNQSYKFSGPILSVFAGIIFSALMLTKPVLVPAATIVALVAAWIIKGHALSYKKQILLLISGIVGFGLVMAPWLGFTKLATDSYVLTPQRLPVLNITLGLDPDTDGWVTISEDTFCSMFTENESALCTGIGVFMADPVRVINLSVRKIERLWAYPWNDYKIRVLCLSLAQQTLVHQLMLFAGFFGILVFLSNRRYFNPPSFQSSGAQAARFIVDSSLVIILAHGILLLFQAHDRYGFTAIPFFLIFGIFAASRCFNLAFAQRGLLPLSISLISAYIAFTADLKPFVASILNSVDAIFYCELLARLAILFICALGFYLAMRAVNLSNSSRKFAVVLSIFTFVLGASVISASAYSSNVIHEWTALVKPGTTVSRSIFLPKERFQKNTPEWAMIFFDGDAQSGKAKFFLNGKPIESEVRPIYEFDSTANLLLQYQIASCILAAKADDLRQWRAIEVPLSMLRQGMLNTISTEAPKDSQYMIYGSYQPALHMRLKELALRHFSPTRLYYNLNEFEARTPRNMRPKILDGKCSLTLNGKTREIYLRDLSPSPGRQFGQYRMYLVLGSPIHPKEGKAVAQGKDNASYTFGSFDLTPATPLIKGIPVPIDVCQLNDVKISLTGECSGPANSVFACQIIMKDKGNLGNDPYLPGTPINIACDGSSKKFTVAGTFPSAFIMQPHKELQICCATGRFPIKLNNLQLTLQAVKMPDIIKRRLEFY